MKYILEAYSLNPVTGIYSRLGELTTFMNVEWNQKSNKPSTLNFQLSVYSPDTAFIQPFKNWILLKREGVAYLFNIVNVRGGLQTDSGLISVDCFSIQYALNQLYVEGSYIATNTDAGTIASNLIAIAQAKPNANYGIQIGTVGTIGNTNETLFYQSIGAALTNQADNIIGYNFEFKPILGSDDKLSYVQFNCSKSMGSVRSDLPPLELGYSVNVVDFGMASEVYNKIYTLGADTGSVDVASSSSTGSQGIFGLREKINKEPSIFIKSNLQSKGDSYLNTTQGVMLEVGFQLTEGISPYYGQFGLMDTLYVKIKIANTFFNFQGTAQVTEISFNYDHSTNKEVITPIIKYYQQK